MESKSTFEFLAHKNPPLPHFALSEGALETGQTFGLTHSGLEIEAGERHSGSSVATIGPGESDERMMMQMADDESEEEAKDPFGVHFQDLGSSFFPDEDIFVIYELGDDVTPSPRDWVALVKSTVLSDPGLDVLKPSSDTLASIDDAKELSLWRETAPQVSTNKDFPNLRSILVNLKSLEIPPNDEDTYEFVYASSKDKRILGRSCPFVVSNEAHADVGVKDITSILEVLVDVGDIPGLDSGSLKHLKSFMEPVENRSEPDCVVRFKRRHPPPPPMASVVEGANGIRGRLLSARRGSDLLFGMDEGGDDEFEGEVDGLNLYDRDGSVEELLNVLEKGHLEILGSVSRMTSYMTVPSAEESFHSSTTMKLQTEQDPEDNEEDDDRGAADGAEAAATAKDSATRSTTPSSTGKSVVIGCPNCAIYREKMEEMRKMQEESQKQIEEIQAKLKEGKELLAKTSPSALVSLSAKDSATRSRKLEEKLRNIRIIKRRLEDELVEAIGRAARSKEEAMEVRQMMHENATRMEANEVEMQELRSEVGAKEKELKDLHEYVENIHYTLATKGYREMRNENGDVTNLEPSANGKIVELENATGWNLSESRKKGALRAKLTNQSGVIDHLHHTLGRLEKERQDALRRAESAEKSFETQTLEMSKLKEAVAKMKQEASKAANRVESLSKIIVNERQTLQARMEKVRDALKKVESARRLKNVAGSGSDRAAAGAAIAAERTLMGHEPLPAPSVSNQKVEPMTPSSSSDFTDRRRFVSPSQAMTATATTSVPSSSTKSTLNSFVKDVGQRWNSQRQHPQERRNRRDPTPAESERDKATTGPTKSKGKRVQSKERPRCCPFCREPFSPVTTNAIIQDHIRSHHDGSDVVCNGNHCNNEAVNNDSRGKGLTSTDLWMNKIRSLENEEDDTDFEKRSFVFGRPTGASSSKKGGRRRRRGGANVREGGESSRDDDRLGRFGGVVGTGASATIVGAANSVAAIAKSWNEAKR